MLKEPITNSKTPPSEDYAIRVTGVSKTFKIPHEKIDSVRGAAASLFKRGGFEEFKALDDVSFEVKKGEFFGIIGRNGSGKSTLLKILAGIYQADRGSVKINGMVSPFLELGIGFNPELSGRDNIYLNATVLGLTKKQIDKKFDSIVKFSELARFIDQKLKNYSSGMQVRLAFSVSIHANRDILLMDEVLAVGDTNFQSKCLEEFNKYKDLGKTVILVTHDINTVQRYCDRALLLQNGKIMKIGKAEEVGDAYLFENMSDEEKRVREHEKQRIIQAEENLKYMKGKELEAEKKRIELEKAKQEEERKNKIAEITNVEFLNKDGDKKNVFETGELIDICINFEINSQIKEKPNFAIGLHSVSGGQVFGYNTQIDKILINENDKLIILRLNNPNILKGEYFINVLCFGDVSGIKYDFKPKICYIQIFAKGKKNNYKGIIDIDHKWITTY